MCRKVFLSLIILILLPHLEFSLSARTKAPAYSMQRRSTARNPDGSYSLVAAEFVFVSSDGRVHNVQKAGDQVLNEMFYFPDKGRFVVDHKNKRIVKEAPPSQQQCPIRTPEYYTSNQNFLEQAVVLGIKAYVFRFVYNDPKNGTMFRDIYYAPEVGCSALKAVFYKDGYIERMTEVVALDLKEPDASAFKMPDYPLIEKQ